MRCSQRKLLLGVGSERPSRYDVGVDLSKGPAEFRAPLKYPAGVQAVGAERAADQGGFQVAVRLPGLAGAEPAPGNRVLSAFQQPQRAHVAGRWNQLHCIAIERRALAVDAEPCGDPAEAVALPAGDPAERPRVHPTEPRLGA